MEIKTISGRHSKNIGGKENLRSQPREKIQQKKHEDAGNIRRFNLSLILILAELIIKQSGAGVHGTPCFPWTGRVLF